MNHTDIFYSLWMYNIRANIHIIYTLNEYIKDRNVGSDDYIAADEKPVKVNLYGISIIAIDILNGSNIIIFINTVYCFIFLANIILIKYFQFKKVYLDEKHN